MSSFSLRGSVKDRVAKCLLNDKNMSDDRLIQNIWYQDLLSLGLTKEQSKDIIEMLRVDQLTNTESIRRNRQLLQAEDPKLYGYNQYKKEKGEKIKREIHV